MQSHTAITSIEILHSQNLGKMQNLGWDFNFACEILRTQNLMGKCRISHEGESKKSFCYFLLLQKVESPLTL